MPIDIIIVNNVMSDLIFFKFTLWEASTNMVFLFVYDFKRILFIHIGFKIEKFEKVLMKS